MNPSDLAIIAPGLILAVTSHEMAHGLVAKWGGDETAAEQGRLTLNPIPHIDLFGTIIVPMLLFVSKAGFLIGWAKPVPIDPSRLRHRRWLIVVSLAGVAMNFILLVISALLFKTTQWAAAPALELGASENILRGLLGLFLYSAMINLVLIIFNLIPIPPLDGSRVVYELFFSRSRRATEVFRRLETFGIVIIILCFRPIGVVLGFALNALAALLGAR